jgi:hypothetical protein
MRIQSDDMIGKILGLDIPRRINHREQGADR